MQKRNSIAVPAAAGCVMGVVVVMLPDAWSFSHVMIVSLPIAVMVGMAVGMISIHFPKK